MGLLGLELELLQLGQGLLQGGDVLLHAVLASAEVDDRLAADLVRREGPEGLAARHLRLRGLAHAVGLGAGRLGSRGRGRGGLLGDLHARQDLGGGRSGHLRGA